MDSMLESDRRSLGNAHGTTISRTSDGVRTVMDKMQQGQSFNFEELGEQGKSAKRIIDHAESLSKTYGYDNRQAAEAAVKASASFGTPLMGITGSGASVSVDGSVSATNLTNQALEDRKNDSQGQKH